MEARLKAATERCLTQKRGVFVRTARRGAGRHCHPEPARTCLGRLCGAVLYGSRQLGGSSLEAPHIEGARAQQTPAASSSSTCFTYVAWMWSGVVSTGLARHASMYFGCVAVQC